MTDSVLLWCLIRQYAPLPIENTHDNESICLRTDHASRHHGACLTRFITAHPLESRRNRLWATLLAKERAAAGPGAFVLCAHACLDTATTLGHWSLSFFYTEQIPAK